MASNAIWNRPLDEPEARVLRSFGRYFGPGTPEEAFAIRSLERRGLVWRHPGPNPGLWEITASGEAFRADPPLPEGED